MTDFWVKFSAFITLGGVVLWHAYRDIKNSTTNKENEEAANDLKDFNRIKEDTNRLSDSELNDEMLKWSKARDKVKNKR